VTKPIPEARVKLIEQVVAAWTRRGPRSDRVRHAAFLRAYFRGLGEEDLAERSAYDAAACAMSHYALGAVRKGRAPRIRAFNPEAGRDGFDSRHTIIQVVTDDMPFLVDSVGIVLARERLSIHLLVHPVLAVERTAGGRLRSVLGEGGPGARNESWQLYEVDRVVGEARLRQIEKALATALDDVRAAVADWMPIRARVRELSAALASAPPPLPAREVGEARELLDWIESAHFVLLGYRRYRLVRGSRRDRLVPDPGSGLGLLRPGHGGRRAAAHVLTGELRRRARARELLIITKANSVSSVHRGTYLDYVGVKTFDARGEVDGEHRFIGLWTSTVYYRSAREIPVLRSKVEQVIDSFGLSPTSHDAKAVVNVLETFPRDELFQADVPELIRIVRGVVNLYERRQVRLLVRRDPYERFYSCLVYVPRDRYSTDVRHRIEAILLRGLRGEAFETQVQISESQHARVHVVVRIPRGARPFERFDTLERALARAAMNWQDLLREALAARLDEAQALALMARYAGVFPAAYHEDIDPADALEDIGDLEALRAHPDALRLNLHRPRGQAATRLHLKLAKLGLPIPISDMLPLLENFGLRVIAERPYEVSWPEGGSAWIQDLELEHRDGLLIQIDAVETIFKEGIDAAWRGLVENDGFNRLLLAARLPIRDIVVLRLVARYLLQTGVPFSQASMERTLGAHPGIARGLVDRFRAQFEPSVPPKRREVLAQRASAAITRAVEQISSLDDDRVLRAFHAVVRAMLRTNFYQPAEDGTPREYVSVKFDPAAIPDLPLPRPKFEIFVYGPSVEGVHLRMGHVARGGIRWSDRRDDFRTEILGLMKAQNVKNTLIVPVGAKGGFVPKRLAAAAPREERDREGIRCYRLFIRGLLDVTDNIVDGRIVPPASVVRRDSDDAYLVVAADKGTATFSDVANEISGAQGFWLGDAFASGGSAGYDHKKMGITARGAWECVKRHFRELGVDIQRQPFTVAGIGDMSGDVFGNGMLLSPHIRLVAAFNHQHVFLDPAPDPAASFAERARLFRLPRSTWDDYDRRRLSRGGAIHPRSAKGIPLSAEMRAVLGVDAAQLTPNELIRAILRMRVDLLWNGGIGTYVKSADERHGEVGDRANDAVRVDGREVRARVLGEGGNLGCTQRGRIEYARAGGRINTDFIDNSAGVNTSDVEVNVKILVSDPVRRGRLPVRQRDRVLARMTDEVAGLVLRNNYLQSQALSVLETTAAQRLAEYQQFVRALERSGDLNRAIEFLPSEDEFIERRKRGEGLTRPELAVILAYSKIWLSEALLESDISRDPYLSRELERYFPAELRRRFPREIGEHRLRREIIVTAVTNSLVNRMGPVFAWRAQADTDASAVQVARAYTIARETFSMRDTWGAIEALDNRVAASVQYAALHESGRLLRHASYWLLAHRRDGLHVDRAVAEFRPGADALAAAADRVVTGAQHERVTAARDAHAAAGLPPAVALRLASFEVLEATFDLVELAARFRLPVETTAQAYFEAGSALGLDWIREQAAALAVDGPWQAAARTALRDGAARLHRRLVERFLAARRRGTLAARIEAWTATLGEEHVQWTRTLTDMRAAGRPDFATLSVGLEAIRRLAGD
jgi:glutamate dehydrogenase